MVTDFRKVKAEPLASCPVSYQFPVKHQFIHNAHVQIAIKKAAGLAACQAHCIINGTWTRP